MITADVAYSFMNTDKFWRAVGLYGCDDGILNFVDMEGVAFEDRIHASLYYDYEKNVFYDEDGTLIHDILSIVSTNDLYLFKHHKKFMVTEHQSVPHGLVELDYVGISD